MVSEHTQQEITLKQNQLNRIYSSVHFEMSLDKTPKPQCAIIYVQLSNNNLLVHWPISYAVSTAVQWLAALSPHS